MGNEYAGTCPNLACGFHFAGSAWPITCPRCRARRPEKEERDGGEKTKTQEVEAELPPVRPGVPK